nr:hypothetical protein [Geothrix alkalitolerans]
MREALRTFRVDRIQASELLGPFEAVAGRGLEDYLGKIRTEKNRL